MSKKYAKGGALTKAERVVLALALGPKSLDELRTLLAGELNADNDVHAELIRDRPVNALKKARMDGFRIFFCNTTKMYYLAAKRPT